MQMNVCNSVIQTIEHVRNKIQKRKKYVQMSIGCVCVFMHAVYISYGIQMNLLAYSKKIERYASDRHFIITCFDDDCILNDWLTDWFVNCATFRHANNLQRQTTNDHKIFISPVFVSFRECVSELSQLVHTEHIFSISLECAKNNNNQNI